RQARVTASARAGAGDDAGDVARAVTHQRHGLFAQRREHDLPLLALGQHPPAFGIDDLHDVVVVPVVDAGVLGAVDAGARAVQLRESVAVVTVDAQQAADSLAHGLAPAPRDEGAATQLQAVAQP